MRCKILLSTLGLAFLIGDYSAAQNTSELRDSKSFSEITDQKRAIARAVH